MLDASITLAWPFQEVEPAASKAREHDAAYLELAVGKDLLRATLDGALGDAARAEGVSLAGHSMG